MSQKGKVPVIFYHINLLNIWLDHVLFNQVLFIISFFHPVRTTIIPLCVMLLKDGGP